MYSLKCLLWEDCVGVMVCIVHLWCSPLFFSPTHKFAYLTEFLSCCNAEEPLSSLWTHWIFLRVQSCFLSVTDMHWIVSSSINSFCLNLEAEKKKWPSPTHGIWPLVSLANYQSHINEPQFSRDGSVLFWIWRKIRILCEEKQPNYLRVFGERTHTYRHVSPLLFWHSAETCLCDEMVMSSLVLLWSQPPPPPLEDLMHSVS